jgi:hypothetical protein
MPLERAPARDRIGANRPRRRPRATQTRRTGDQDGGTLRFTDQAHDQNNVTRLGDESVAFEGGSAKAV